MEMVDKFLASQGTKVKVIDVKQNQLIACNYLLQKGQIRIYCVKEVVEKPEPPHLVPPLPRSYLYKAHVGMNLNSGRFYIHASQKDYRDTWMPEVEAIKEWCGEDIFNNEWYGDHYTVTNPELVKLGNLIPKLELPEFSVLYQNENIDKILKSTNELLPLIENLKFVKENWVK